MPLYQLQGQEEEASGADDLIKLISAAVGSQRRKATQGDIYRRAAAGELKPEYEVDPATGSYKASYKSVNPKDAAEAAILQEKLRRMKSMGGGNAYQGAVDSSSDMFPKDYDEYGLPKTYGSKSALRMQQGSKEALDAIKKANADTQLFTVTKDLVDNLKQQYGSSVTKPADVRNSLEGMFKKPITGLGRMFQSSVGGDVPLSTYKAGRKGFISNIARSVGAEKGVLTDPDVARAGSLLPSEFSTKQESEALWTQIEDIIKNRLTKNQGVIDKYKGQNFGGMEEEAIEFDSLEEADSANLPSGTRVLIKGQGYGTVK